MSALFQWAFALCAAMASIGLCKMLLPNSNMEKTFRFVVSVFFLSSLLSPVVIRFPDLLVDVPLHTQAEIEERSNRLDEMARTQALDTARRRLRQIIGEKLSGMGINVHDVAINFTTSAQGEILLESVDITLCISHRYEEAELTKYLENAFGSSVWLHYTGQEVN